MNTSKIIKNILNIDEYRHDTPFATFFYKSKAEMKNAQGKCFTNIFYLKDFNFSNNPFTHFTPNIFKTAHYTENGSLAGYTQKNLQQVNCFSIDIDSKTQSVACIKNVLLKNHLSPTLILNTEKGYHVFFKLEYPINKKNDFKVAKEISKSIRLFLKDKINHIDLGCNHFSIFRCPNPKNVLYYNENATVSFSALKNKFVKNDLAKNEKKYNNKDLYTGKKQVNTPWFNALFNIKKVEEKHDGCGRNNILFTLSLACFSSKLTKEKCIKKLNVFNNNLKNPLEYSEFLKTINSAYSGKYYGATKEYVLTLLSIYREDIKNPQRLFFYKHKKNRQQRKNSYIYEWQKDFKKWISQSKTTYVQSSLQDIAEKTKIPLSSLKIALKSLEEKNIIKVKTKKGKYGYTKIIFIKKYIQEIIDKRKTNIENLIEYFNTVVKKTVKKIRIKKRKSLQEHKKRRYNLIS